MEDSKICGYSENEFGIILAMVKLLILFQCSYWFVFIFDCLEVKHSPYYRDSIHHFFILYWLIVPFLAGLPIVFGLNVSKFLRILAIIFYIPFCYLLLIVCILNPITWILSAIFLGRVE